MTANVTALTGAAALATTTSGPGYVAITCALPINPLAGTALTQLLQVVDGALYAAKHAGGGHCAFEPMKLRRTGRELRHFAPQSRHASCEIAWPRQILQF